MDGDDIQSASSERDAGKVEESHSDGEADVGYWRLQNVSTLSESNSLEDISSASELAKCQIEVCAWQCVLLRLYKLSK